MAEPDDTVEKFGELSALYLGNILYALESTAMTLEQSGKAEHAAFYRGIARKLAEAWGRERRQSRSGGEPEAEG
ncbi:MAG: hypothetical protein ACT4OZ_10850 [Gemmatimonadota bacterium]